MKKFYFVIGVCMMASVFRSVHANVQTPDGDLVASFEQRVKLFETFLAGRPALLDKQPSPKSPSGLVFKYHRLEDHKIEYDIRKTDSLVSPYMGFITVSHVLATSYECGDLADPDHNAYYRLEEKEFSTVESARLKKDDASCYRREKTGLKGEGQDRRVSEKFIFAYQNKQWVFKDVEGYLDALIRAAFGTPARGWLPVEDNDLWKTLIQ